MKIQLPSSVLLVIDIQSRLMPAIANEKEVVGNATKLLTASRLLDVPTLVTEQNPNGLGSTVPELATGHARTVFKDTFDACEEPGFMELLPDAAKVIVVGCEAHVCVMQTVLGLLAQGRDVAVTSDAIGSRTSGNRDAALNRMARHGADLVTTEMVLFEWLQSSRHEHFKPVLDLVR